MTPHDLIASFGKLGEAPNGVERLRELVLQLAVQGKLVPQEPADTVGDLLQSLDAQRNALIQQKRLRRPRRLPAVSEDEAPFDIPETWRWARCQDLFFVVTDGDHQAPPKTPSGVPFLVIGNVSGGAIDFTDTRFVGSDYFEGLDWIRRPTEGDVLYTVTGSFGIVLIVDTARPFCVQRHIGILKSAEGPSAAYLRIALQSPASRDYATEKATGTAQKTVSLTTLRSMPIPVPPVAEQHRIAERVNELMALLDRLEAARAARDGTRQAARDAVLAALGDANDDEETEVAWTRFAERLHELVAHPDDIPLVRQTVLELAVRGKLVPHDPNDEPAMPGETDPASALPRSWRTTTMRSVLREKLANGKSVPTREGGFPVLRLSAIRGRTVDYQHQKGGAWSAADAAKYTVAEGDYFIARGNGSIELVGRGALAAQAPSDPVAFPDTMIRVRVEPERLLTSYLAYLWDSRSVREQIVERARTTSGIFKISQGDVRDIRISVPPIKEQRRIAGRVDELMALLDRLEHHLTEATTTHAAFAAAAVHHLDA